MWTELWWGRDYVCPLKVQDGQMEELLTSIGTSHFGSVLCSSECCVLYSIWTRQHAVQAVSECRVQLPVLFVGKQLLLQIFDQHYGVLTLECVHRLHERTLTHRNRLHFLFWNCLILFCHLLLSFYPLNEDLCKTIGTIGRNTALQARTIFLKFRDKIYLRQGLGN